MIRNPAELHHLLNRNQRLLGLDVGTKTIGLALSDITCLIATPFSTIRRKKLAADLAELFRIVDAHDVGALVVGLPISMDGSEGPRCQSIRSFADSVLSQRDIPLAFWDERWSTSAVTRTLLDADASRRRRAEVVDKMAASYILQGVLDLINKPQLEDPQCR